MMKTEMVTLRCMALFLNFLTLLLVRVGLLLESSLSGWMEVALFMSRALFVSRGPVPVSRGILGPLRVGRQDVVSRL